MTSAASLMCEGRLMMSRECDCVESTCKNCFVELFFAMARYGRRLLFLKLNAVAIACHYCVG